MIINDVNYAIRLLTKTPGFSLLAIFVMAAGISLSLFSFSFLYTVDSKPLPFKNSESLVIINSFQKGVMDFGFELNLHDYYEIRKNVKGLSEFGAYRSATVNVSGNDGARRYNAIETEANIFQITRTEPLIGREFTDQDNQLGAARVVVIGFDVWKNQFGGNPSIVEKTLRVNGQPHQVIGVMPQGYVFPNRADIWLPMRQDVNQQTRSEVGDYFGIAHLEEGVSIKEVNRQLDVIMKRIETRHPETNHDMGAYVGTLQESMGTRDGNVVIFSMYTISVLILFLASINVGNLLLIRAIERGKETAIRVALGAPRGRLISQMLWESIIICSVGGLIGLLLTAWGMELLEQTVQTFTFDKPVFWWKFGIDLFTFKLFIIFVVTSIVLTGLLPAWRNSGSDFNAVLRDGTQGALGKKAGKLNRILVTSEIFLSMVVMIAASVVVVGSYLASLADYGADTENVLIAKINLTDTRYEQGEDKSTFVNALQTRLENSAGIGDVMISTSLPGHWADTPRLAIEGKAYNKKGGFPRANSISVSPGSLQELGIELKLGRYFTHSDDDPTKSTAIVTESFVSQHYPNESPIGKRFRFVESKSEEVQWINIVGVVEHTIQGNARSGDRGDFASVFRPFSQNPMSAVTIALKMKTNKTVVTNRLRKALQFIDPELPAFRIETYEQRLKRNSAPGRFISKLFLLFSIAALILATSGIYGVMSNTVNQRKQEIGVKRALGAKDQRITREFLWTGFKQLLWGGAPGLLIGCTMGATMSQMFGVGLSTFVFIAIAMVTIISSVVILATYIPTRRALQMEPSQALHYE